MRKKMKNTTAGIEHEMNILDVMCKTIIWEMVEKN